MIVTRTETDGWITCARSRVEHGHCPGYESQPCRVVVETVAKTFGDHHGDTSDPYYPIPSVSHEYLHTVNGEPPTCEHCGSPANLSLEPRPTYDRLSDKGPDELVSRREAERVAARRDAAALDAGERQAAALEAIAAGGGQPGEVEQLRAALARRDEQLERLLATLTPNGDNGHDEEPEQRPTDVKPRPPRRRSA